MKRSMAQGSRKSTSTHRWSLGLEQLETREMFSATPGVSIYEVPTAGGTQLVCQMTAASEQMSVVRSADGIQFNVEGNLQDVAGNFSYLSIIAQSGNNTIVIGPNMTTGVCVWGGSGSDLISTGASNDAFRGRSGNETFVALGGVNNQFFAGSGDTNIWATAGNYYAAGTGTLETHFINSFINTSDYTLDGHLLTEPGTNTQDAFYGTWQNYGFNPLFSSGGPLFSDIHQGACGDCYFMSALSAIALTDPKQVSNIIAPLGDGTFAEQFSYKGQNYFVRVDGELPTNYDGSLFYAGLGAQGSTWVALIEKGWAYMKAYEQSYAADYYFPDQGGFASIALPALGGQGEYSPSASLFGYSSYYFAGWVNWQLNQGKAMEIGFQNDISGVLYGDHEYTIVGATVENGQVTGLWVRNPWGIDLQDSNGNPTMADPGHNDGYDDGLVWVDAATAFGDMNDLGAATV